MVNSLLLEWDDGSTSCVVASLRHRIILRRQEENERGGSIKAMNSRGRKNAVHQMKASHHGLCNQGGDMKKRFRLLLEGRVTARPRTQGQNLEYLVRDK